MKHTAFFYIIIALFAQLFMCRHEQSENTQTATPPPPATTVAMQDVARDSSTEIAKIKAINSQFIALENGEKVNLPKPGNDSTVTIFFVRHAETIEGKSSLSGQGQARAGYLANLMQGAGIFIIYVSDNGSTQTALPISQACQSEFNIFDAKDKTTFLKSVLHNDMGRRVLVVGKAEIIPVLVNELSGKDIAEPMLNTEYDNVYVAIAKNMGDAEIKRLKY